MTSILAEPEPPQEQTPAPSLLGPLSDPLVIGTICGLLAAVGYTATNVCLRQVVGQNPAWVSCLRAMPTILIFGPWLFLNRRPGVALWPSAKVLFYIVLGGIAAQLVGNILFQWSLGVVGLAMAAPLCLGTLIVGGATMGRVLLKEPITLRVATALMLLVVAIGVLSLGAPQAHESVVRSLGPAGSLHSGDAWHVTAGVLAACLSGVCFALLGVSIRYGVTNRSSAAATMFTVGLVGTVGLAVMSLCQIGISGMANTPGPALTAMLSAGLLNALSFLAMTKALQLTNVAYAYALNATQATLAAISGVLIFGEATTPTLGLGVGLTIAGLVWMRRGDRERGRYGVKS